MSLVYRGLVAFEKVAQVDDIPAGRGLRVTIQGIEVGLFRVGDTVHAMENRCPHAGDPLSEGILEGCVIRCAGHGWEFDLRTGHRPDDSDGFPIPCFAVELEGGAVWVDLESPVNLPRKRGARSW